MTEQSNKAVQVRMSPELRAGAEARAARYGLSLSEYLRALLLHDLVEAERLEALRLGQRAEGEKGE